MIICFTGTGNSLDVARRLADGLGGEEIVRLEGELLRRPELLATGDATERIIWAFPIYSWDVPPVVADFIRRLPDSVSLRAARHLMLCTCGDDIGMADRRWRRLIESRGWKAGEAFAVVMPNTYTLMKGFDVDPAELAAAKLAAMPAAVEAIAARIAGGVDAPCPAELPRGAFPRLKSGIVRAWFERYAMSAKPFHAGGGCTGCGLCARSCPTGNISMVAADTSGGKEPSWGADCAMCLRCYHICPRRAVAYGRHATDGKGQWLNPCLQEAESKK